MVLLDYLFASQMVIEWCEAHPLPNDDASLADLLMPARLSMDGADVFGVRPAYHRDNVVRAGLPSHVWNHVPVLQLAMSVRPMVDALADEGQWLGILDDTVFDVVVRGLWVTVQYDLTMAETGHARFDEFLEVLVDFSERVRRDFVATCPDVRRHSMYGEWFQQTST